jgi:hypothetical protein
MQLKLETPLQACALLTTAKRMFARNLRAVAADYAESEQGAEAELDDLRRILSRGGAESSRSLRS